MIVSGKLTVRDSVAATTIKQSKAPLENNDEMGTQKLFLWVSSNILFLMVSGSNSVEKD